MDTSKKVDELTALKVENLLLQQEVLQGRVKDLGAQAQALLESAAKALEVSLDECQYDVSQRAFVPRPQQPAAPASAPE